MMNRSSKIAVAVLLLFVTGAIASGSQQKGASSKGWIDLFNGKDLTGWRMIGKGKFEIEDGALTSRGNIGLGLLVYEARKFRDFVLEVEWKVNHKCNNSGIFIRFPEKSDDPWHSVNNGYEVQIDDCDTDGLKQQTGSLYDQSPATKLASKPAGQWNLYEITVVGQRYTVVLNGEKVNEFEGSRGRDGYIGLQAHDPVSRVSFRRVRVNPVN